jgi:hypothetical protein
MLPTNITKERISTMRKVMMVSVLCAIFLLIGCSHAVSPNLVKKIAASDLKCPESDIKVEQVTNNNWKASGCDKEQSYVCSNANFMSDGTCLKQ